MRWVVLAGLLLLSIGTAAAQDFQMNATDFGYALLVNTIGNLQVASGFLDVLYAAGDSANGGNDSMFRNMWGVAYGGILLSGLNNQITGLVLKELANESNTNLTEARDNIGDSITLLGREWETVFGNASYTGGLALLLRGQLEALNNRSYTATNMSGVEVPVIEAYADALASMIADGVKFFYRLAQEISDAFYI